MAGERHGRGDEAGLLLAGYGLACRRGERLIFASLDLEVAAGELVLLRGPNGSGKSTLLRLIAGLLAAERGVLMWQGRAIHHAETYQAELAYLGHGDAAKPELTPREDVRFWLALRGARGRAGDVAEGALLRFGLEALADLPCRLLSAGQRRRLALARVLASGARLWLLDEPFNALDEGAIGAVQAMVAEHRAAGGLVVMAAHGAAPVAPSQELDLTEIGASAAIEEAG